LYTLDKAYLVWALSFFFPGLHRFYLGKIGSGLLYLFTGGLFFFGTVVDFFRLPQMVREANLKYEYHRALTAGRENMPPGRRAKPRETIEKVILKTARKNMGLTTPGQVALEGDISIQEAKDYLEKLAAKGFAEMKIRKSGTIVYYFPDLGEPLSNTDFEDI
jgi:predicted transcriptional regulator